MLLNLLILVGLVFIIVIRVLINLLDIVLVLILVLVVSLKIYIRVWGHLSAAWGWGVYNALLCMCEWLTGASSALIYSCIPIEVLIISATVISFARLKVSFQVVMIFLIATMLEIPNLNEVWSPVSAHLIIISIAINWQAISILKYLRHYVDILLLVVMLRRVHLMSWLQIINSILLRLVWEDSTLLLLVLVSYHTMLLHQLSVVLWLMVHSLQPLS